MENNIILNYTLEKYNKKYRNRRHRLLKYTKKQVEDFDKQYGHYIFNDKTYKLEFDYYLLKDRKWALIDDTYYEIPKPVRVTWFRNLSVGAQLITCVVGVGGVTSAVVFPSLFVTVWNKGGKPVDPEPTPTKEWYEDSAYIKNLSFSDIGTTTKEIIVNGQIHKVRLIGINHDTFEDGTTAHTTWEFNNLISDSEGYSLAYQWHDTTFENTTNRVYQNSSIRKVLCGSGDWDLANYNVYCATKASNSKTTPVWDDTYTYTFNNNKTIFSMLPEKLRNVLKSVKKKVRAGSTYGAVDCNDKLFMLSAREMGLPEADPGESKPFEPNDEGTVYKYYDNATDDKRIKQQVKGSDSASTGSATIKTSTVYQYNVYSFAGYNSKTQGKGGHYWLRSPDSSNNNNAWNYFGNGSFRNLSVNATAIGIAPAFCL